MPVVEELKGCGILFVGTVSGNRLKGCAMKDEKMLKAEGRGTSDHRFEGVINCIAVRRFDNRVVNLLSSYVGTEPTTVAKRWYKKQETHVQIPMPAIVHEYNKFMGGVYLLDMMTAMYKYRLKSRRWYMYVFWHTVMIALVNAWLLWRRHHNQIDQPMSKLALRRFQAAVAGCLTSAGQRLGRGRPKRREETESTSSSTPRRLLSSRRAVPVSKVLRLDGIEHFPQYADQRQRCNVCRDSDTVHFSFIRCGKCGVHLCLNKARNCFASYHGK